MSERDNDSDNLDHFFQKAARDPDVQFNENDWRKLEEKLDAEASRISADQPNRWRLGMASVGTILVLTGITYFLLPDRIQNRLSYSREESRMDARTEKKMITKADSLGKQTQPYQASLQTNRIQPEKVSNSQVERGIIPVNTPRPLNPSIKLQQEKSVSQETEATPRGPIENGITESKSAERKGQSIIVTFSSDEDSVDLMSVKKDKPGIEKSEMISDSVVKSRKSSVPARWSMVISFTPDFSSTTSREYTSPGVAFGLVAHYHISNTFSISTGIIRSHKKYWGYGNEYKPPKGYWKKNTNGVIPESIYGTCNVLEIPLSLQYKVVKMKRSRMYVTAGVSSYVMLNESYHFTFENPNPGSKEDWNSNRTTRFLLSIANVSASYERDILPNVAVGIEPYVKIPVTGIGWSGLKLFSAGAAFTLRYSLQKKKH